MLLTLILSLTVSQQQGRLLYANDDDWDWATQHARKAVSPLAVDYGEMSWSGLDWAEAGLTGPIRGVVIGQLNPSSRVTTQMLSTLRNEAWTLVEGQAGAVVEALAKPAPQVLVFMFDAACGLALELNGADRVALVRFVQGGGRVLVLDDGGRFGQVLAAFLERDPISPFICVAPRPVSGPKPPIPGLPGLSANRPPSVPVATDDQLRPDPTPVGVPSERVTELVASFAAVGSADSVAMRCNVAGARECVALRVVFGPSKKRK